MPLQGLFPVRRSRSYVSPYINGGEAKRRKKIARTAPTNKTERKAGTHKLTDSGRRPRLEWTKVGLEIPEDKFPKTHDQKKFLRDFWTVLAKVKWLRSELVLLYCKCNYMKSRRVFFPWHTFSSAAAAVLLLFFFALTARRRMSPFLRGRTRNCGNGLSSSENGSFLSAPAFRQGGKERRSGIPTISTISHRIGSPTVRGKNINCQKSAVRGKQESAQCGIFADPSQQGKAISAVHGKSRIVFMQKVEVHTFPRLGELRLEHSKKKPTSPFPIL